MTMFGFPSPAWARPAIQSTARMIGERIGGPAKVLEFAPRSIKLARPVGKWNLEGCMPRIICSFVAFFLGLSPALPFKLSGTDRRAWSEEWRGSLRYHE